jgi:hypothetical protein
MEELKYEAIWPRLFNFYASDYKRYDGRMNERFECDSADDVREYAARMTESWKADVHVYECGDPNEVIYSTRGIDNL